MAGEKRECSRHPRPDAFSRPRSGSREQARQEDHPREWRRLADDHLEISPGIFTLASRARMEKG